MSKSFWDTASFLQTKPKYDGKGKHEVFFEHFKDQSLGESKKPVAVLAYDVCLLYTSPSPRDATLSRMPSSA